MKKHIPNIITLGNLTCGLLAILSVFSDTPHYAAYFIFGGLFLDFFDGFFARILKLDGELGKQLDSLADLVTFGVAPGFLMYKLIEFSISSSFNPMKEAQVLTSFFPFVAFLIPILSAVRLAKFNIATNQTDQFIGLPTPASAIFFASLSMLISFGFSFVGTPFNIILNPYILMTLVVVISLLLNANIPLIALKFKSFGWKGNEVRFIFLGVALLVILSALLISNIFVSIPIIILLYLFISIINNFTKKAK